MLGGFDDRVENTERIRERGVHERHLNKKLPINEQTITE